MSSITTNTVKLMEMLPESDQRKIYKMTMEFVLAWNPEELGLIPNDETVAALEEGEDMIRHPEKYKSYANFDELMEEILNEP